MKIDIEKLSADTKKAIQKGSERRELYLANAKIEKEKDLKKMKAKVEKVLSAIPDICEKQTALGKNSAVVYELPRTEYESKFPYNELHPSSLQGAAEIIWNTCKLANFQPTLEFWHDGAGINSGFNIVIHW